MWARSCFEWIMGRNKILLPTLVTMLLWGSLFPMVKLGFAAYHVTSTADILLFAGIRFVLCGGIICLFSLLRNRASFSAARRSMLPILATGLFAIVLHYGFSYLGLDSIASSKTALLKQAGPVFYVCFSFLFIREDRPTLQKIAAAVIGFLGVVALNLTPTGVTFSMGDLLILAASFCTVFANVISKKVFAAVEPVTAAGISQLFGGAVLLLVGICMGGSVQFAADRSLWIMGYICAASVVSYCLWYGVVKKGELSRLFVVKFAEPAFACAFGAVLLREDIWKLQYLAAFVLICTAVWLANRKGKTA